MAAAGPTPTPISNQPSPPPPPAMKYGLPPAHTTRTKAPARQTMTGTPPSSSSPDLPSMVDSLPIITARSFLTGTPPATAPFSQETSTRTTPTVATIRKTPTTCSPDQAPTPPPFWMDSPSRQVMPVVAIAAAAVSSVEMVPPPSMIAH